MPSDVRDFFDVVAYRTQGNVNLNSADQTLIRAIRAAMKRADCSARHLAGSLEPNLWPAEFKQSPEAFVMSKIR